MKGKGARLVKQIISMITCKTDAMKASLMVTALTVLSKKKKFSLGAISAKINDAIDGILLNKDKDNEEQAASSKAIVLYSNKAAGETSNNIILRHHDDDDDKYPDLRHSLFDEEKEEELAQLLEDPDSSVSAIDMVKNSKENEGESFNLERQIDEVADLFITKFHKRMRLQKLLSFKRHQQMVERSA